MDLSVRNAGEQLRAFRLSKNLTLAAVAKIIGVSGSTVQNWEVNVPPKQSSYEKCRNFYGPMFDKLEWPPSRFINRNYYKHSLLRIRKLTKVTMVMLRTKEMSQQEMYDYVDAVWKLCGK